MSLEPIKVEEDTTSNHHQIVEQQQPIKVDEAVQLCQFEEKKCHQRCHKSYHYCMRHILCDKDAPFKQCHFVASKNNQPCHTAIDINSIQPYCNKHQYELGLKEKKKPKRPALPTKTIAHNNIKQIPKKCRLMYSSGRLDSRLLFHFARKSTAKDYCYRKNSIKLLYYSVFNDDDDENKQHVEDLPKIYEKYTEQSLISRYHRNVKLEKQLNYHSKNLTNIIKQIHSNRNDIQLVYNCGLYFGGNNNIQCIAKTSTPNNNNNNNNTNKPLKCTNKSMSGMSYCQQHIKLNKKQVLFNLCKFKKAGDTNNEICGNLIIGKRVKKPRNAFCEQHQTTINTVKVKPTTPRIITKPINNPLNLHSNMVSIPNSSRCLPPTMKYHSINTTLPTPTPMVARAVKNNMDPRLMTPLTLNMASNKPPTTNVVVNTPKTSCYNQPQTAKPPSNNIMTINGPIVKQTINHPSQHFSKDRPPNNNTPASFSGGNVFNSSSDISRATSSHVAPARFVTSNDFNNTFGGSRTIINQLNSNLNLPLNISQNVALNMSNNNRLPNNFIPPPGGHQIIVQQNHHLTNSSRISQHLQGARTNQNVNTNFPYVKNPNGSSNGFRG